MTLPLRPLPPAPAEAGFRDEHYRLAVRPEKITLAAASPDGVAVGIQTLRQLLSGQRARLAIPCMILGHVRFLDRVVATLADLFPFRYLHFGGDEAKTGEWEASARIKERMQELGHTQEAGVQSVFTAHLTHAAEARGRRIIGWDEIIEHDTPAPGTAVMYWRDSEKEDRQLDLRALREGHPLVLANWSQTYFDLYQKAGPGLVFEPLAICGNLPLEKVYSWHPLERYPEDLRSGILGAQAQLWTEYIPDSAHLDYMAYPRACALAQVLWSGDDRKAFEDFKDRLASHLPGLDRLGVAYRPELP